MTGLRGLLASTLRASGRRRAAAVTIAACSVNPRLLLNSPGRGYSFAYDCGICHERVETTEPLLESCGLCLFCFAIPVEWRAA